MAPRPMKGGGSKQMEKMCLVGTKEKVEHRSFNRTGKSKKEKGVYWNLNA